MTIFGTPNIPNLIGFSQVAPSSPYSSLSGQDRLGYADAGIDMVIFVPDNDPVTFTRRLGADVVPRLREL